MSNRDLDDYLSYQGMVARKNGEDIRDLLLRVAALEAKLEELLRERQTQKSPG